MLDKKQIRMTFLLAFKIGHKEVQTACNNVFGPGTANEYTVQQWFKRFCKGDESLEDEEHSGRPSEVDSDQLRAIIEADPLTTTWEIAQELRVDHSMIIWRLKQIGKVKTLDEWVPHELTKNFKNHRFGVLSSHILCNNKPFLDQDMICNEKWILYDNQQQPAQWLDQEEAPEHFPKPNLHQKKVMVIVRWSAAGLIHYSFLNPGKTITSEKYAQQADEIHWKLQCLQPVLVNRKGPVLHNNARLHIVQPKVVQALQIERIGLQSFASSAIFHPTSCQLTTTSSSILTTVCRENAFITSRKQKMLSRSLLNPEAWIFML